VRGASSTSSLENARTEAKIILCFEFAEGRAVRSCLLLVATVRGALQPFEDPEVKNRGGEDWALHC